VFFQRTSLFMPPNVPAVDLLRLSEKSVTGQTSTIYSVHKEQYTLYIVYCEAGKHFSDSLVMRSRGTPLFYILTYD
jgi:hypothetical protein